MEKEQAIAVTLRAEVDSVQSHYFSSSIYCVDCAVLDGVFWYKAKFEVEPFTERFMFVWFKESELKFIDTKFN